MPHILIGLVLLSTFPTYVSSHHLMEKKARDISCGSRACWRMCSENIGGRAFLCWVEGLRFLYPLVFLSMWLLVLPLVYLTGLGL